MRTTTIGAGKTKGMFGWRTRLPLVSVLATLALLVGSGIDSTAHAQATVDYDVDDDGLIEVATVAQLNAIRWDLNGDGGVDPGRDTVGYSEAFPNAVASPLMGCATGCTGYELTADLDLGNAGGSFTGWEPIGGMSGAFTATFDGGAPDFTVSNLFIDSSMQGIGLFGATGGGSVIRNVTLRDVDITGGPLTGALVGRNLGSIIDSTAGGAVTGTGNFVGGLVGWNNGPIIDSHATGNVDGVQWVGGLAGASFGAGGVNRISRSTAGGAVTGTGNFVGGLVGWNNGPISYSHATGDTVRGVQWVGGLVGSNEGAGVSEISRSTAGGAVIGTDRVGGLVGKNNGPISNSHATGDVNGVEWVGGLVGSNYDDDAWNGSAVGLNTIEGSTASGVVTGTGNLVGGLVGWNNGPISDSDARGALVSGRGSAGGLVGSNYDQHGDGTNTIRRSTASAAVEGTIHLGGLVGWNNGPISDSHASGSGSVQGQTESGGLVGYNDGSSITDSSASGDVGDAASGGPSVGGLVGLNKGGMIRGSNATGDVTSTNSKIGGLVGSNKGTITESVASGTVTGRGLGRVHTNSAEMLSSRHGDYRSSVRTHSAGPAGSARQRQTAELAGAQRDPVCRRAGLQVARAAAPLRQLAYRLHTDEPLVEEWGARPGV